jgi:hypothetical protein
LRESSVSVHDEADVLWQWATGKDGVEKFTSPQLVPRSRQAPVGPRLGFIVSLRRSLHPNCGCEDEDEDYLLVFWVTRHLLPRIPILENAKYASESSQKQKKELEKRQEWVEKDKKASKKPNPRCIFAFSLLDAKPRHGGENLRRTSTSTINRREDRRDKRIRDR